MRYSKAHSIATKVAAAIPALLLAGAVLAMATGQSMATKADAKKTGKKCETCHDDPPDKDNVNSYGKKYKASQG